MSQMCGWGGCTRLKGHPTDDREGEGSHADEWPPEADLPPLPSLPPPSDMAVEYLELARHHLDAEHAGERLAEAVRALELGSGPRPEDQWRSEVWQFGTERVRALREALAAWEAHQWPPDTRTGP